MEVKPGYKKTEAGVIPEEWDVKPLAAIADKIMVGIASAATHAYRSKGVPMFRNQNVKVGFLDDSDLLFIAPEYEAVFKNKRLRGGDLLTMRTGYPGVTAIVPSQYDSAQSFTTLITRPRQQEAESPYLCHFINSECGQRFFTQSQIGGAQKNVNVGTLRKMPILLPKPTEQRAIAEALSDVDGLLGGLDRLIAKKRDLKQAIMQQLLTGQTRLPGFHDEWEVMTLGEAGQFLKGSGVTKDQARSGSLACVRYGELYTHHNDVIREFNSWISPAVASTSVRLRKGDILFAGSGETKEEIGKCAAFISDAEAYAGGDIVILRPHEADAVFLGYFLNTASINRQKASRGQGDAVVHIGSTALAAIRCRIPKPVEQTAIAAVLNEMDAELAALEQRREKTRALKQGMMQELLTGRIRLVETSGKVIPFPSFTPSKIAIPSHNWQIDEAVIIGVLAGQFGTEEWPLPRKRRVKLTYLLHRYAGRQTDDYLKKAAGPYNPKTKYQGPEKIAIENGYVQEHHNGKYAGFIAGKKIGQAEAYFAEWYPGAKEWLEPFRFEKTEELELLATVDMAMQDIQKENKPVVFALVKQLIHDHPEWEAKLGREIFSDDNIARAMQKCAELL